MEWHQALAIYGKEGHGWHIPEKGSEGYKMIKEIQNSARPAPGPVAQTKARRLKKKVEEPAPPPVEPVVSRKPRRIKKAINLQRVPEDVEGVIKEYVGDINFEEKKKRFATQMKGLQKFIEMLEEWVDERTEYERSWYELDDSSLFYFLEREFEDAPEFIQVMSDWVKNHLAITDSKGHPNQNSKFRVDSLRTMIDVLKKIKKMGENFLKGKENYMSLYEEKDIYPGYSSDIYEGQFYDNKINTAFVFPMSLYDNVERIRDEAEDDEDEDEDEYAYDYSLFGKFSK